MITFALYMICNRCSSSVSRSFKSFSPHNPNQMPCRARPSRKFFSGVNVARMICSVRQIPGRYQRYLMTTWRSIEEKLFFSVSFRSHTCWSAWCDKLKVVAWWRNLCHDDNWSCVSVCCLLASSSVCAVCATHDISWQINPSTHIELQLRHLYSAVWNLWAVTNHHRCHHVPISAIAFQPAQSELFVVL